MIPSLVVLLNKVSQTKNPTLLNLQAKMWRSNYDTINCATNSYLENQAMDSDQVMREIQRFYLAKDVGLKEAAKAVPDRNFKVTLPRQKVTILIVGNHNQAKRKFLDLYFNESRSAGFISKVNYDKMDKIFITHGNQRKVLTGETVLDYCPHLAQLKNVPGLQDYLTTEIASRHTKSLVSFILAPENMTEPMPTQYSNIDSRDANNNSSSHRVLQRQRSLDMRQAIGTLSDAADLIFLFFDPTGIVPPKETLQPFEVHWETHHEKLLLLLAKADEAECSEQTREDVLARMVREVWRNPTVRRVGYLPEIYCPDLTSGIRDDERLWNVIQNVADQSVDKALQQLEADAKSVKAKLEEMMEKNEKAKERYESSGTPWIWSTLVVIALLGVFIYHYNEQICEPEFEVIHHLCADMKRNKNLLMLIGVVAFIYAVYKALERKPDLLTAEEERLLLFRIRHAEQALLRKEFMERMYGGMNLH